MREENTREVREKPASQNIDSRYSRVFLRCFDTVFRRPYLYFSIALKVILFLSDFGLKFVKM